MAELQREGQPWDDGTSVHVKAREYWMLNGQRASDVYEVSVVKGRKTPAQIGVELLAALKAKCAEREAATPEHTIRDDLDLPETLTV